MKKLILLICLLVASATTALAQNRIDRMVENFSSLGNSTFTSAVERDSKTHRIKKVVKKLSMEGTSTFQLRSAFKAEKNNGKYSESADNYVRTMILTTSDSKTDRIYMLRIEGDDHNANSETTIIIKYK